MRIVAFRIEPFTTPALPPTVSAPGSASERERLAEAAMDLRRAVFVDEQRVESELEFDGLDADALHMVGLEDDEVVGVLRMLTEGDRVRIGRMAVRRDRRRAGIGAALAAGALACARRQGASQADVHAQTRAADFYARLGFEVVGEEFEEAGIPHLEMSRVLARTGDPD